jgi:hypothetical protein
VTISVPSILRVVLIVAGAKTDAATVISVVILAAGLLEKY